MKVAVKRLRIHIDKNRDFAKVCWYMRLSQAYAQYRQIFVKELGVWSKLYHTNILPLLGFIIEGSYPLLVSEWMENSTASSYIAENENADIPKLVRLVNLLSWRTLKVPLN